MPLPYQTYRPQGGPGSVASQPVDLLEGYERRGGVGGHKAAMGQAISGAMTGASYGSMVPVIGTLAGLGIGAAIGGLKGIIGRKAASAPTDFQAGDARDAVTKAYRQYLGRDPEAGAIETHLRNQGLQGGDRYVGEQGLQAVMKAIQSSPEAQAYAQRGQAPTQAGPSPMGGRLDDIRQRFGSGQGPINLTALLSALQGRG